MKEKLLQVKIPLVSDFLTVRGGDSPGDQTQFCEGHVVNTNVIFQPIVEEMLKCDSEKIIISIAGGSGVGKSGIAALLSHYLTANNILAYTLTGDNYPKRRPFLNDAERFNIFRRVGLKAVVKNNLYTPDVQTCLTQLQQEMRDADESLIKTYPWLSSYIEGGKNGLVQYLGTSNEQDFDELNAILKAFKSGEPRIALKRLGRDEFGLSYETVDFSQTEVLVVEWTHALSDELKHVDIPVLLCSAPEETLMRRKLRNRGNEQTDTPFISMVLQIEQEKINAMAHHAKVLLSQDCKLTTVEAFVKTLKKA